MNSPRPEPDTTDALQRLIEAGSRVRALQPSERAELLTRIERRRAHATHPKRWVMTGVGVACALAVVLFQLSRGPLGAPVDGPMSLPAPSMARAPDALGTPAPASAEPRPSVPAASPPARPADGARAPSVRRLSLGGRAELELDDDARVALPSDAELAGHGPVVIRLERGRALAQVSPRGADEPLSIVTPHVQVVVVGTRFSVSVDTLATTVSVEHGRVRVEQAGQSLLLDAGQTLRSDDARWSARPAPAVSEARAEQPAPARRRDACAVEVEASQRRACLQRVTAGKGLAAQNALLALGLLERDGFGDRAAALQHFLEYQRRHPRGVLAPEVALAQVQTLLLDGQPLAARAATDRYARSFPADVATERRLRELVAHSK